MRYFHFLYCGEDKLRFWQNVVIEAGDAEEARQRLFAFANEGGIRLIEIDEEETKEVDTKVVNPGWRSNAAPPLHVYAAGGRIWINEGLGRVRLLQRVFNALKKS